MQVWPPWYSPCVACTVLWVQQQLLRSRGRGSRHSRSFSALSKKLSKTNERIKLCSHWNSLTVQMYGNIYTVRTKITHTLWKLIFAKCWDQLFPWWRIKLSLMWASTIFKWTSILLLLDTGQGCKWSLKFWLPKIIQSRKVFVWISLSKRVELSWFFICWKQSVFIGIWLSVCRVLKNQPLSPMLYLEFIITIFWQELWYLK